MPVSRKYKSLKKSSKTKKHSKNVKKYKSKTRKNINKLRGGQYDNKTGCIKSSACFNGATAQFIKECMRKYFKDNNYKIIDEEEDKIKKILYNKLYLTKNYAGTILWDTDKNFIKSKVYGEDTEVTINAVIKDILYNYFAELEKKEKAEKNTAFNELYP